jgi:hypothetical protein
VKFAVNDLVAQFTFHDHDTNTQDEQDIEILSSYLNKPGDNNTPPGIELTVSSVLEQNSRLVF